MNICYNEKEVGNYMKILKIFIILVLVCVFGVTGCDKKSNNEIDSMESSTKITTTTSTNKTTNSSTTTKKETTTTGKTTVKQSTKKSTKKPTTTTTKKAGPTLIDGKIECDKNNAEFVAYVENYKKNYSLMTSEQAKKAPYVVFFYTKDEVEDYSNYANRLGYDKEGSSIPYENSTCKGKMYTIILRITWYNGKRLNNEVYIPATPKNKLISAASYLEQNGLV